MIAQAVLTTVSLDQGENSMLLLFKCDILDRSSPLWGSCWGLVSPFGSLRMSSQSNLFLWKRGRGGGAWVWGELFSSFSFFGQYYMGVNSFSTKEASFLCLSTFQISESACRPGFHSGISVFSVDGGFKVFFFHLTQDLMWSFRLRVFPCKIPCFISPCPDSEAFPWMPWVSRLLYRFFSI